MCKHHGLTMLTHYVYKMECHELWNKSVRDKLKSSLNEFALFKENVMYIIGVARGGPGANFFFVTLTLMRKISSFFKNHFRSAVIALFRVKM